MSDDIRAEIKAHAEVAVTIARARYERAAMLADAALAIALEAAAVAGEADKWTDAAKRYFVIADTVEIPDEPLAYSDRDCFSEAAE